MHATGPGIEVVEPQIAGPTQSLEDGATYPVRYYFPGYERPGGKKKLDINRINEMRKGVVIESVPEIIEESQAGSPQVERLPGGFEDKGLEVHRITAFEEASQVDLENIKSFHTLVTVKGKAICGNTWRKI